MANQAIAGDSIIDNLAPRDKDYHAQLEGKGFENKAEVPSEWNGHTAVKYTKREGMTYGSYKQISRALSHPFKWIKSKYTGDRTSLKKNWESLKEGAVIGEKTARTIAGVAGSIVFPFMYLFKDSQLYKDFNRDTFGAAKHGAIVEKAYYAEEINMDPATEQQVRELKRDHAGLLGYMAANNGREVEKITQIEAAQILNPELGYTPHDNLTIRWMYDPKNPNSRENRMELRESQGTGHFFRLIGKGLRNGVNSFIFVPQGDYSKAKSVTFCNARDGSSVADFGEQLRTVQDYCILYDAVEKGWDKEAGKMAISMSNEENEASSVIEDLKKQILARRGRVVIDSKTGSVRIYSKTMNLNKTDPNSFLTGVVIKIGKEDKKALDANHDPKLAGHQKDTAGEPVKMPPPLPTEKDKAAQNESPQDEYDGYGSFANEESALRNKRDPIPGGIIDPLYSDSGPLEKTNNMGDFQETNDMKGVD